MNDEFRLKASGIRMILFDVDGVLTDGTFWRVGEEEVKRFHSRDGVGLVLARRAGLKLGLISRRRSTAVAARAEELQTAFRAPRHGKRSPRSRKRCHRSR
jgi:3-deoxy-D-manno-octulosonate 8-phosphate phosphatase (KDO 8-P phosphatase)